ncbi:vesicle transport through interaction with t-SNAREs homolog 1B [Gastrophryne carolinensis]
MSSEHFEAIHELFRAHYEQLQEAPEKLRAGLGDEKKKLLRDFEKKRAEANDMLVQMEEELLSAPPAFQRDMMSKLRVYKRNLGKLQTEVKNAAMTYENSWRGFHVENEHNNTSRSQRNLLLEGNQSLSRASDSIARSHHLAAETDAVGQGIVEELSGQREQLERTKDRLVNTSENLSRSTKILRSMSRKIVTNKLLLFIIIILELAILGGLVYYKFFRK